MILHLPIIFIHSLGSDDGVGGEIISKQVLHNNSFLMLLASRVFFRSPPLFLIVSGFCFPQLCAFIIAKLLCYKWHRS